MAATWHVTSQNLSTEISETGPGFQSVWQVRYMVDTGLAKGTVGQVNVPAAQFSAEVVKEAIDAAVFHLDKVANL